MVGYPNVSKSTVALRWRRLVPNPLVTADYAVEALPGAAAYAWDIGDDGFVVGAMPMSTWPPCLLLVASRWDGHRYGQLCDGRTSHALSPARVADRR